MSAPLPTEAQHVARIARAGRALADATAVAERQWADHQRVPAPTLDYLLRSSREMTAALAADYQPETPAEHTARIAYDEKGAS